jgi:predicted O-methyltransferase YrrM
MAETWLEQLYKCVVGHTILDEEKAHVLFHAARRAATLDGNVAELGVFHGGMCWALSKLLPNKTIYGFDTFEGLPDPERSDLFAVNIEDVREYLKEQKNVILHKGLIQDTAHRVRDEQFSLVHLDGDLYESQHFGMSFFYPRMVAGGLMVIDDYGHEGWPGCQKAIDEFLADKSENLITTFDFIKEDGAAIHQAVIVKESDRKFEIPTDSIETL